MHLLVKTSAWNVNDPSRLKVKNLAFVVDRNNVRADFARNSEKKKKKKKKKKNHYVEDGERLGACQGVRIDTVSPISLGSTIAKAAFNQPS